VSEITMSAFLGPTRLLVKKQVAKTILNCSSLHYGPIESLVKAPPATSTRFFAAQASATKPSRTSNKAAKDDGEGYFQTKQAEKERRRALFDSRQERRQRLLTRRAGKPRDEKRQEFRKWFIQKKVRDEYLERKARQAGLGWKIQVAAILERPPIVLPDIEPWEQDYLDLEAHVAQFGKQYPKEFIHAESDVLESPLMTPISNYHEELLKYLPKGYSPAPRVTEADLSGDVRTTNRKLKTSIYLALQEDGKWQLPTVDLNEDETLLDAAKRALNSKAGSQVEFWCPSNAPFAVNMEATEGADKSYGTKTFYIKLQYDEGEVFKTDVTFDDYGWLDRFEMADRVKLEQSEASARFYQYML
jgi:large subunit ribosomal protein L46